MQDKIEKIIGAVRFEVQPETMGTSTVRGRMIFFLRKTGEDWRQIGAEISNEVPMSKIEENKAAFVEEFRKQLQEGFINEHNFCLFQEEMVEFDDVATLDDNWEVKQI